MARSAMDSRRTALAAFDVRSSDNRPTSGGSLTWLDLVRGLAMIPDNELLRPLSEPRSLLWRGDSFRDLSNPPSRSRSGWMLPAS